MKFWGVSKHSWTASHSIYSSLASDSRACSHGKLLVVNHSSCDNRTRSEDIEFVAIGFVMLPSLFFIEDAYANAHGPFLKIDRRKE